MKLAYTTLLALPGLLITSACSSLAGGPGSDRALAVGFSSMAADCAEHDVVFFGELHDNDRCHEQQLDLLERLHAKRPDIIISMEMFERDVQHLVDQYLAGKLEEAAFRKEARAWKNWHHYRGVVNFAKKHHLQVVAANAPVALVRKVSTGGLATVRGEADIAHRVSAPTDGLYYAAFKAAMSGHGVFDDVKLGRYYEAQCLRDDTMAESIAMALSAARVSGRKPLVLHLCGRMHSDDRLGTVERLLQRMPGVSVRVISTTPVAWFQTGNGDYRLMAPQPVKARSSMPRKPSGKPAGKPAGEPAKVEGAAVTKPAEKPVGEDEVEEVVVAAEVVDPDARPGLGFKPLYDIGDEYGVGVDYPIPGGAADKGGIEKGDIIKSIAGEELQDIEHYMEVLGGLKIGKKVKVVVLRNKKKVKLDVVIGVSGR